jgi:hypothetical protein
MNWKPITPETEPKTNRILVFTPTEEADDPARFRTLLSRLLYTATDATHYAELYYPGDPGREEVFELSAGQKIKVTQEEHAVAIRKVDSLSSSLIIIPKSGNKITVK